MSSRALQPLPKLCRFDVGQGVTCSTPVFCRGFCPRHYSQLKRAGAFTDVQRKGPVDTSLVLANVSTVKRARRKLLQSMPVIADAFLRGVQVQAQNGKTDAAQWAMLHTHTVDPVATPSTGPSSGGTTINIGFKVSGVKGQD